MSTYQSKNAEAPLSVEHVNELNARFEMASAEDIVRWAHETFGNDLTTLCAMTSDTVLVDLVARRAAGSEVVFLETGHHFLETLVHVEEVKRKYADRVSFTTATAGLPPADMWQTAADQCCNLRKVVPMEDALAKKRAWISGVRRADSSVRANTPVIEIDKRGKVKVNPIATWSDEELQLHLSLHEVPLHPLLTQGYPSIGCAPCTRRVAEGEDARSGRWSGQAKTECGLHV
jgi:phosphoadenosine phosphosulfate reductase